MRFSIWLVPTGRFVVRSPDGTAAHYAATLDEAETTRAFMEWYCG